MFHAVVDDQHTLWCGFVCFGNHLNAVCLMCVCSVDCCDLNVLIRQLLHYGFFLSLRSSRLSAQSVGYVIVKVLASLGCGIMKVLSSVESIFVKVLNLVVFVLI